MDRVTTIDELIERNQANGKHFFDEKTLEFFDSKVETDLEDWTETHGLFITSEKRCFEDYTRVFTVRAANLETGDVITLGTFGKMESLEEAWDCLSKIQDGRTFKGKKALEYIE